MTTLRELWENTVWRWAMVSAGAIIVLLVLVGGGWYWYSRSQQTSLEAFSRSSHLYQEAASEGKAEKIGEARNALETFLRENPRSRAVPFAAYYLGNLLYQQKEYGPARIAYAQVISRGARDDLSLLSRLGIAYAWEAEAQYASALQAYRDGLSAASPKNFLYEELMVGLARMQESQQDVAQALETYRGLLKERPDSSRADEVRSRIAMLSGQGNSARGAR